MKNKFQRTITLVCGIFMMSAMAFAGDINEDEALRIAQNYLKDKKLVSVSSPVASSKRKASSIKHPAYYVFNAENEGGFVIVNGDDQGNPILGYSDNGYFNPSNIHPALRQYLESYNELTANNGAHRASVTPGRIIVEPLCKSEWGQDAPFNLYAPKFDGVSAPCGCVATAMAQIMRHFEWPATGRGSITYNCSGYGVLSKDFTQSTYNWAAMKDKGGQIRNQETREAMALLTYDAGLAVRMIYSANGSGAYHEDSRKAFANNFQYKASTLRVLHKECYATVQEWLDIIKNELDSNRPIYYCGQDTVNGGHAYVVDGYDSNGYVHVNWGWDGISNGFYDITSLAPDGTNYDFGESVRMIIGIEPDYSGEDTKMAQYYLYMENAPECSGTQALGKPFIVTYSYIYNVGFDNHTYTFGVGLYDENGNFMKNISVKSSQIEKSYTQTMKPMHGFVDFNIAAALDEGLPDGKYALRCISHEEGYDEWLLPETVGGTAVNWVPILVKDGKVYLNSSEGAVCPTSIDVIFDDSTSALAGGSSILYKEYYDLQGRRLPSDASNDNLPSHRGVVIVKQYMSDGKVISKKCFSK